MPNSKGTMRHRCPDEKGGGPWRCLDYSICQYLGGHPEEKLKQRLARKRELKEKELKRLEDSGKRTKVTAIPFIPCNRTPF
jgi:hypothetical protein